MTNKKKKHIRAQMEKTGMSHQSVVNQWRSEPPAAPPPIPAAGGDRTLAELMAELRATSIVAVAAGIHRVAARSANLLVAQAMARDASAQAFVAKTGSVETSVNERECKLLLAAGAASDDTQVFRVHTDVPHQSFSRQCSACSRWIWLGREQRSAKCVCGHSYRVIFDAPRADWRLPLGLRCIHCGIAQGLKEVGLGVGPWHFVNEWQMRCARCADFASRGSDLQIERDEQQGRFVRHSNRVSLDVVRTFVAEHRLRVDWDKRFRSSTGELNGRLLEYWRLPILG